MSRAVFRVVRRCRSFEPAANIGLEDVLQTEFSVKGVPDLELSLYEVEDAHEIHTQVFAEHRAQLDPKPEEGMLLEVSGILADERVVALEEGHFAFTRRAHRILQLADLAEREFFAKSLMREAAARARSVPLEEWTTYVAGKIAAGDQEWASHFQAHPKWARFFARLAKGHTS